MTGGRGGNTNAPRACLAASCARRSRCASSRRPSPPDPGSTQEGLRCAMPPAQHSPRRTTSSHPDAANLRPWPGERQSRGPHSFMDPHHGAAEPTGGLCGHPKNTLLGKEEETLEASALSRSLRGISTDQCGKRRPRPTGTIRGSTLPDVFAESPDLACRCTDLSADRGYDSELLKETPWETWRIRPIIDARLIWRHEKAEPGHGPAQRITRPLHEEKADTIVYTERGEVRCIYPDTGTERDLAFHGFEAMRGTLKYRCPAATYGFDCQGREDCEAAGDCRTNGYGRIVRIPSRPTAASSPRRRAAR